MRRTPRLERTADAARSAAFPLAVARLWRYQPDTARTPMTSRVRNWCDASAWQLARAPFLVVNFQKE